jgi:7-keto-8-aminopelargonate synthetase-like enzyme
MNRLDDILDEELRNLRRQGLYRELRGLEGAQSPHVKVAGKDLLNFSSNDYLGLSNEPALKQAAVRAIERYGAGAGASRLICGSLPPHHELDQTISVFKQTEAALSFSTGYAAALGTICALVGSNDTIILDKLVHASIVDAARLSGATLRVFPHNDLNRLEEILAWADRTAAKSVIRQESGCDDEASSQRFSSASENRKKRVLVVTESVFSMDGDHAPLSQMVQLKQKFGAWLMVDEAHATGVYGKRRSGLAEELGLNERVEVQMGTLGKALGASGGYICGSRQLVDYLVNRARSFVFSTAPVPAAAAAAQAGIQFVQSEAGAQRCHQLWHRIREFTSALTGPAPKPGSAIIPILLGDEDRAMNVSSKLRELGIFIPAIRYPTVARGRARLRVTLSAAHTSLEVRQLIQALETLKLPACRESSDPRPNAPSRQT